MKRKFTNVFLLVAIGIAALTSFVSCKDYEDDLRTESEIQNGLIWDEIDRLDIRIDTLRDHLYSELAALKLLQQNCSTNCSIKIDEIWRYFDNYYITDSLYTKSEIDALLKAQLSSEELQQQVNNAVNQAINTTEILNNLYQNFKNYVEQNNYYLVDLDTLEYYVLKTELANYIPEVDLSNYVTKEEMRTELLKYITSEELQTLLAEYAKKADLEKFVTKEELAAAITVVNESIAALRLDVTTAQNTANDAMQKAQDAADAAQRAADAARAAQDTANAAKAAAEAAQALADQLNVTVTNLETVVIPGLQQSVNDLNQKYIDLDNKVTHVADTARWAYENAELALTIINKMDSAYQEAFQRLQDKDAELEAKDAELAEHFNYVDRRCDTLRQDLEAVRDEAYQNYLKALDAIQDVKNQLNYRIDSLGIDTRERFFDLTKDVNDLRQDMIEAQERIGNLEGNVGELNNKVDDLYGKVDDLTVELIKTNARITSDSIRIDDLEARMQAVEDEIPGMKDRLDSLENAVDQVKEDLAEVMEDVEELTCRVQNIEDLLNKLITGILVQGVYNTIYGSFSTPFGIESNVLATYYGKNIPGTIEFPTAIDNFYYYPGTYPEDERIYLTEDEVGVFKGDRSFTNSNSNKELFNDNTGNAGKIYLTVNSAQKQDFTGAQFKLVNTRDEEAQVKLGALKTDDNWLKTFGVGAATRSAENNLYYADATITSNFYAAAPKINLSKSEAEEIFKDIKNNVNTPSQIKIGAIAKALYHVATSDILTAYGVKAPWTQTVISANGEKQEVARATYSTYNVAATAIKPLSYSFMADPKFNFDHVPGIYRLEKLINDFADRIKKQLPNHLADQFDVEKFDTSRIERISLESIDFTGFKVAVEFDDNIEVPLGDVSVNLGDILVPGQTIETTIPLDDLSDLYFEYVDPNTGEIIHENVQGLPENMPVTITVPQQTVTVGEQTVGVGTKIVHLSFKYEDEEMTKLLQQKFEEMKASLEGINPMLEYIRWYLTSINGLIDRVNEYSLDPLVDNFVDKLISALDRINAKLAPYMRPTDWLQPIGFAYDGSLKRLTATSSQPVLVNKNNLSLILTSRTGELLAPAYKKWVAITKAYKADGTEAPASVVDAANTGKLNTILPGNTRSVQLKNLKSGYTYVICIQCIDYSGYVSAKRYKIKVK